MKSASDPLQERPLRTTSSSCIRMPSPSPTPRATTPIIRTRPARILRSRRRIRRRLTRRLHLLLHLHIIRRAPVLEPTSATTAVEATATTTALLLLLEVAAHAHIVYTAHVRVRDVVVHSVPRRLRATPGVTVGGAAASATALGLAFVFLLLEGELVLGCVGWSVVTATVAALLLLLLSLIHI